MNAQYKNEITALERERNLKEQIVNSYKNKIINEILNSDVPVITNIVQKPKKTFWQKMLSIF